MADLEKELTSLRLVDEPPRSRRAAWVVIALLVLMVAASTLFWWGSGVFAATEVETTTPRVERSEGVPSGTPLLTASGYVVARRKAVVSAKIQGRLADLRIEELVRQVRRHLRDEEAAEGLLQRLIVLVVEEA